MRGGWALMFSIHELNGIKANASKNLKLACVEYHAHNFDCMIGDEKDKLICKLCYDLIDLKNKLRELSEDK